MSVPVSTTVEGHGMPSEYKSGQMNAMDGDGEPPLYFNPATGFEFEWTVPPPGFYGVKEGWAAPKMKADFVEAA